MQLVYNCSKDPDREAGREGRMREGRRRDGRRGDGRREDGRRGDATGKGCGFTGSPGIDRL